MPDVRLLTKAMRFIRLLASLSCLVSIGCGLGNYERSDAEAETPPQNIDSGRLALVSIGMSEQEVLGLLGPPYELRGPQVAPIHVTSDFPDPNDQSDCPSRIKCHCVQPVREYFYYRGKTGPSIRIWIDAAGLVCCRDLSDIEITGLIWH